MRLCVPLLACVLLTACAAGRDYAGPPAPPLAPSARFVRSPEGADTAAPAVARWWTQFGDRTLDELEERALAGNPGLAASRARIRQSRATIRQERARRLPSLAATGQYVHADLPGVDLGSGNDGSGSSGESGDGRDALNFIYAGLDASWEVDLFGGARRSVEAARADAEVAEANAADAQVQLTAEVARTYVLLRDMQTRLELASRAGALHAQELELVRQRFARGTSSRIDVERIESDVQTSRAQVLPLSAEVDIQRNALAVLTGQAPGTLDAMLATGAGVPMPPASVAVGDPATLLRHRPDIRAAERRLAAQTARVGVAQAARLPRFNFRGILGLGGTSLSALTDLDGIAALAMPVLQWNILDFGAGAARVHQADAARDVAEAEYRQAVLSALQNAEDALARFGKRRLALVALARVEASARRLALLTDQRYHAGTATRIDALLAQRQALVAEADRVAGVAALSGDYIAVQKSLGLGWHSD